MVTLAADTPRSYSNEVDPLFEELGVIATDIIYEGAAVGDNASGYMRPLASGDPFRGFAERNADNSAGAANAINVKLRRHGIAYLSVASASAVTDVGRPVYATDDNTFTLAKTGTRIGRVAKWDTSTYCYVYFEAEQIGRGGLQDNVLAKTADYTVVMPGDSGKLLTTRGATAAVVFLLPAPATGLSGAEVEFFNAVDQAMTVSGTADKIISFNDVDADAVVFSTSSEKYGASVRAKCDGTSWLVQKLCGNTMTVTT